MKAIDLSSCGLLDLRVQDFFWEGGGVLIRSCPVSLYLVLVDCFFFTNFFSNILCSDDPIVPLSAQAPTQFRFPGSVHVVLELQHRRGLC